jgi:AraC-like DNA-binding protein
LKIYKKLGSAKSRPVDLEPQEPLDQLCNRVLTEQLRRADEMSTKFFVPQLRDHVMEHESLHFHFNPDLIIGLKGTCRLEFIHEHFDLEANGLALIPGGIPHREVARTGRNAGFENMVISVYNETVSVQHQVHDGVKAKRVTEYYDTAKYQLLAQYLEEIAELSHGAPFSPTLGIKGLLLIYFSTLQGLIRRVRDSAPVEKLKISQTKRLVQEHLGNCLLSVKFLAESLHCSSDYLSNLYHLETGERLISYINKERVKAAMALLRTTPLTIAEVAYAVGFESQGYFSRVFKEIVLKNPVAYRRAIEHSVVELEGRPRTIYATAPDDGV